MTQETMPRPLRIEREVSPPPDRGRIMDARTVARDVFGGLVSPAWVRRNVPGKHSPTHSKAFWWEYDVRAWLETTGDIA